MGVEEIEELYIDYSFDNFGSQSSVERLVLGIGVIEECGFFFLNRKICLQTERKNLEERSRSEAQEREGAIDEALVDVEGSELQCGGGGHCHNHSE